MRAKHHASRRKAFTKVDPSLRKRIPQEGRSRSRTQYKRILPPLTRSQEGSRVWKTKTQLVRVHPDAMHRTQLVASGCFCCFAAFAPCIQIANQVRAAFAWCKTWCILLYKQLVDPTCCLAYNKNLENLVIEGNTCISRQHNVGSRVACKLLWYVTYVRASHYCVMLRTHHGVKLSPRSTLRCGT